MCAPPKKKDYYCTIASRDSQRMNLSDACLLIHIPTSPASLFRSFEPNHSSPDPSPALQSFIVQAALPPTQMAGGLNAVFYMSDTVLYNTIPV